MSFQLVKQAYAQCTPGSGSINLGDCLSLGAGSSQTVGDVYARPATLVNVIITNLFVVSGLVFLFMIIYSGFRFINEGTKGKDEARQILQTAIIGLIMMFVAFWVVQIIEVVTGVDIIQGVAG